MPISLSQLEGLVKENGLKCLKNEERNLLMLPFQLTNGSAQVFLRIDPEGQFLQLRSNDLPALSSDPDPVILRELAAMSYQMRWIKFGFDPSDGEVVAYGDMWVMDGQVTAQQVERMVENFVGCLDEAIDRVRSCSTRLRSDADMSGRLSSSAIASLN